MAVVFITNAAIIMGSHTPFSEDLSVPTLCETRTVISVPDVRSRFTITCFSPAGFESVTFVPVRIVQFI